MWAWYTEINKNCKKMNNHNLFIPYQIIKSKKIIDISKKLIYL